MLASLLACGSNVVDFQDQPVPISSAPTPTPAPSVTPTIPTIVTVPHRVSDQYICNVGMTDKFPYFMEMWAAMEVTVWQNGDVQVGGLVANTLVSFPAMTTYYPAARQRDKIYMTAPFVYDVYSEPTGGMWMIILDLEKTNTLVVHFFDPTTETAEGMIDQQLHLTWTFPSTACAHIKYTY